MQNQPNEPVSTEVLLDLLSLIAAKLHQITSQGLVLEVGDDLEVQALQAKLADKQAEVSRTRQQLARVRAIIKRRRDLLKKK